MSTETTSSNIVLDTPLKTFTQSLHKVIQNILYLDNIKMSIAYLSRMNHSLNFVFKNAGHIAIYL